VYTALFLLLKKGIVEFLPAALLRASPTVWQKLFGKS
jgi:hypothetical protein